MEDIIKDLSSPHWWFNLIVGIAIISIGYVITEFFIKPIGILVKNLVKDNGQKAKDKEAAANTMLQIKENDREEMRIYFNLVFVKSAIFARLLMLIVFIPSTGAFFFINSLPVKIALIGFGIWNVFTTLRDLAKLIRYQNHYADILERVRKD